MALNWSAWTVPRWWWKRMVYRLGWLGPTPDAYRLIALEHGMVGEDTRQAHGSG